MFLINKGRLAVLMAVAFGGAAFAIHALDMDHDGVIQGLTTYSIVFGTVFYGLNIAAMVIQPIMSGTCVGRWASKIPEESREPLVAFPSSEARDRRHDPMRA
jgi:hypothetical protein